MGYVLEAAMRDKLLARLDGFPEVVRHDVSIRPDPYGEDALVFRVVLRDNFKVTPPSSAIGERLEQIVTALRERTLRAGLPLFPFVEFVQAAEAA